jgi:hypothetical protein
VGCQCDAPGGCDADDHPGGARCGDRRPGHAAVARVRGRPGHRRAGAPATGTTGTNYNQAQQAADAALVHRKLLLGGICVVLLVIVYFGHKAKYKHILRVKNAK